jgi:hypothetical protein
VGNGELEDTGRAGGFGMNFENFGSEGARGGLGHLYKRAGLSLPEVMGFEVSQPKCLDGLRTA